MKPQRLYNLDWLRVMVIINIIPFHAAWMMTIRQYSYIPQVGLTAQIMRFYVSFISFWHMPMLFFISGAGTCFALNFRSTGEYVRERLKRLLVPLIFFMVFCYPVLVYYKPKTNIDKSITDYFLHFWPNILINLHYRETTGGPAWGHLWFVGYLIIFSFIMLPIFLYLRKKQGREIIARIYVLFSKKGMIFILGIPFVIIYMILSMKWPMRNCNLYADWAWFSYNLTAFSFGYVFCLDERFWQVINRHYRMALIFGVIGTTYILYMIYFVFTRPLFFANTYPSKYIAFPIIYGFNTWFWLIALLGLSRKHLSHPNGFLRYFNRAVYPIYIIHLVVMYVIGSSFFEWRTEIIPEFAIFNVISFAAIIMCYELIKRTKITRFLFGIKG